MAEDAGRTDNQPQSERAMPPPSAAETVLNQEASESMRRGLDAAASGNYDAAEEAFAGTVKTAPRNANARYNLALARQRLGDTDEAVLSYLRAIYLDPGLIEAYKNLGHLYRELGEEEHALEAFRGAIELDNSDDEIYTNIGDLYLELGFFDDAALAYRQAQIVNPDNTLAAERLRETRDETTRQAEHIAELEREVDEHSRDLDRYERLCDAYLMAHREKDALNLANQMVALAPTEPTAYETLALVHETMNDAEEATATWQRVTELTPEDIEAWERLANWRQEMDDLSRRDRRLQSRPASQSRRHERPLQSSGDAARGPDVTMKQSRSTASCIHQFIDSPDDDDPLIGSVQRPDGVAQSCGTARRSARSRTGVHRALS